MISPMAADHPDHRRQVNLFNDCDYIVGGYYDSLRKSLAGLGWAAFTLSHRSCGLPPRSLLLDAVSFPSKSVETAQCRNAGCTRLQC